MCARAAGDRHAEPRAQVIADITRRMGAGMAEFIEKEVETVEDFDTYCHYVAGLVGIGLSKVLLKPQNPATGATQPAQPSLRCALYNAFLCGRVCHPGLASLGNAVSLH